MREMKDANKCSRRTGPLKRRLAAGQRCLEFGFYKRFFGMKSYGVKSSIGYLVAVFLLITI